MIAIECSLHASTFVKGDDERNEYDDDSSLKHPLGLVGDFSFGYDYPMYHGANFIHALTAEMTGEDILTLARADYERIYKEEDEAVGDPGHIPGMLNRAQSAGPYGIWGHDFSDLYFEGIEIYQKDRRINFTIGS